jgi:3'-5' exoribonuclease
MKYITDFEEEEKIIEHYFCKQKQTLNSKNGKKYLSLTLQDKTGTIEAKVWELSNNIQNFDQSDYIKIDGVVSSYQGSLQLTVYKIRKSSEGEYTPEDYVRTTQKNVSTLISQIEDYINSMENKYIKTLMENIFIKNEKINDTFKNHSAAKGMHHAYMGGLIEHTLSVVQICDMLYKHYQNANRDILIATAMLHDLGKIYELSEFPSNDYTDDGELLGHIVICCEIIAIESNKIEGFPHELKSLLQHGVIAHHGIEEYGSPKKPKTIEAYIVHAVDSMDSKVNMFEEAINKNNTQGKWSGYNRSLGVNIRNSNFEK